MPDRYQGLRDAIATGHTSGGLVFGADPDTIDALLRERDNLRAELRHIADATPSRWDADMRDQFQEWAQNRARAALADGEASNG